MYAKLYLMVHGHRSNFLSINIAKLQIIPKLVDNHYKIAILLRNGENKGSKPL